jgi:hypothetical protein
VTRQPPILFLDVDGVLNVLGENYEKCQVELPGARFPHLLHPTEHTLPFLNWAWDVFDVYWCTAWGPDANVIAKWAALPERPCAADIRSASLEWKLDAVKKFLGRKKHTAVWIEDGIGPVAERWVARKHGFFYVHTDFKVGVTKAHAGFLADILNLSMEAWHGKR